MYHSVFLALSTVFGEQQVDSLNLIQHKMLTSNASND
tara:strand:- start:139 stop:249 length:111 start_codon:yes stop_codon:yes gene_type:complete